MVPNLDKSHLIDVSWKPFNDPEKEIVFTVILVVHFLEIIMRKFFEMRVAFSFFLISLFAKQLEEYRRFISLILIFPTGKGEAWSMLTSFLYIRFCTNLHKFFFHQILFICIFIINEN